MLRKYPIPQDRGAPLTSFLRTGLGQSPSQICPVVSAISTRRTHRFSSLNLAGWSTGPFQPAIFLDHFVTGTPCRQAGASPAPSINSAGGLEMSGSPATFRGDLMKERPIPFRGPMVRAILDGRKTQTRRVVKCPAWNVANEFSDDGWPVFEDWENPSVETRVACPYGVPGDRLYVRETWFAHKKFDAVPPRDIPVGDTSIWYQEKSGQKPAPTFAGRNRSARFMPRWASRINLEITNVRVERLQDIGEDDAKAEGCAPVVEGDFVECGTRKTTFRALWNTINAKHATWESNPWVWVIEFKAVS